MPPCPGTHIMVTWFTRFSVQSAISCDFVPLAPRAATATWLSVQIVICSFTSIFLRQLVTQSSIAVTSAWKAVASCLSEMCHCSSLWYLQIPAPVRCWLQAPSVNQTCPFLSRLGHFPQLFPIQYYYLMFTKSVPQGYMLLYHTELTIHFICFVQIRLCHILWFLGSGVSRRYAAISAAGSTAVLTIWQIEEYLQYFCWISSHCPCDYNACSPLQTFAV